MNIPCRAKEKTPLFEGPEKKLEILLAERGAGNGCLRHCPWERVVEAVGAKIVSEISTESMDAYLLSESSLFVWENRIVMITCGKTTLVDAVPVITRLVDKNDISLLIYTRKNQLYPQEQRSNFREDVAFLEHFFPGGSYRLGPGNQDHAHVFLSSGPPFPSDRGVVFELLMHDIEPALMNTFSQEHIGGAAQAEEISGISRIYPDMVRDRFLFSPCGYSLNAVSGPFYFTIHVTPQKQNSYASFETNVKENRYGRLASRVVDIFKPRKFSMVLTTSVDKKASELHKAIGENTFGYGLSEKKHHVFGCGYAATFLNFVRGNIR